MQSTVEHKNPAQAHREAVQRLVRAWYKLTGEDYRELFGVKNENEEVPTSPAKNTQSNGGSYV